jgi:outer membrane protein TolC
LLLAFLRLSAQAQSRPITVAEAVRLASEKYPSVEAARAEAARAAAGVSLARTAYLPRTDFLAQVNRATRNNVFGLLLPQPLPVLPAISGPVLGTNGMESVWGSAAGLRFSWEFFDFGRRRAGVEAAEAGQRRAREAVETERLAAGVAAAEAFLAALAAVQIREAAQAAVERARVFQRTVEALARAGLRPGADAARAAAEAAAAEIRQLRAEETLEQARAELARWLGLPPAELAPIPGKLLELPGEVSLLPSEHPHLRAQRAAIEEAEARGRSVERTWYPRFWLEAAAYGRGTGAHTDGSVGGGASGLGPNFQNWAVGLNVAFPLLDRAALRAQRQREAEGARAEQERYRDLARQLEAEQEKAAARLATARRIAQSTPVQLASARAAEQQALARYQAGLSTAVEVAEAQRLLAQAEAEDALARLEVWRALLELTAAQGNLEPFLNAVGP